MKRLNLKLATTFIISLFILSCRTNEQTDNSNIDKQLVVKELLTEFVDNVKNNKEYNDFYIKKSNLQSKGSSIQVTEKEIQYLLNSLPAEFINLYNQVKDLDFTEEEFMSIANEYDYLLVNSKRSYRARAYT